MTSTITLPSGVTVKHRCEKRYLIVVEFSGEMTWVAASYNEYGRARSALRRWTRNHPRARLYLWDAECGDITPTVVFS